MRKDAGNLITGLDIGTSAIRMVVGQVAERLAGEREGELQILGAASVPSAGVNKGVISSIEDVVSSISACLEQTERMVGVPINSTLVGISGLHIISQASKGVVVVSKVDNEISDEDVARAIDASRAIATPLNFEVLHVLPKGYSIDGQSRIKDPVGMTGMRLEVDSQIILGSASQIKNLTKAVYRTGLNIDDLVLGILATAEAVVTTRQKDVGVLVVNIGVSTTSLVVYEEGEIIHTAIIPIGSENITKDIAIGLRTTLDIAEAVKLEHGDCTPGQVSKRDEIDLGELGAPSHEIVKKQYLSEIIEARVEEILQKIDQELTRIKRSALLPSGVIFTGGGAKLPGIVELGKRNLRLPAILGFPLNVMSVTDRVNDLSFSTAVGLVKWGATAGITIGTSSKVGGGMRRVNQAGNQIKKWIKTLIP
jgi:cell division protein FtsA